jgi:hypothetical protein
MTTVEQIHKTIEINDTALTDEFKEDLRWVLSKAEDINYAYKDWVLFPNDK